MFDYRKGKERYIPNELGSLYIDKSKLSDNERPVIYIGGQMEHRWHILEQTGKTADPGHNMFTGNWFYDYPILFRDKSIINGYNFAKNLEEALKMAELSDVDLITHSFGGIIAALISNNERIHKIYAVHPPITGTPLANPYYIEIFKQYFNKREKLLLKALKLFINTNYGFEQDSFNGVDLKRVNLDKLVVIGSSINPSAEKGIILDLYQMIKKVNYLENDGVVIFDEELFNKLGINYLREDGDYNHFNSCTEKAFDKAYQISKITK